MLAGDRRLPAIGVGAAEADVHGGLGKRLPGHRTEHAHLARLVRTDLDDQRPVRGRRDADACTRRRGRPFDVEVEASRSPGAC